MHINILLGVACEVLVQTTHSGFCFLQPPLWFSDPLKLRISKTEILIEKVNNPCSNTVSHLESGVQLCLPLFQSDTSVLFLPCKFIIPRERQLLLFSSVFSRQQLYNHCTFTETKPILNVLIYIPHYGPAVQPEGKVHHYNHHFKLLRLLDTQRSREKTIPRM